MMRAFSSRAHHALIAGPDAAPVESARRTKLELAGVVGAILLCSVLLVAVVALTTPLLAILGREPIPSPIPSPTPSPTAAALLPAADVAGDDLASLPRYPGSVRSDYEVALDDRYRLIVTEYLASADIDEVRAFYQGVITAHGWDRADIGFSDGEWSYALVDGETLALIEIEEANGLIEIDLQISEALAPPAATPTPVPPMPPAPAAPPPSDDDDDDDDDDETDD